MAANSTIPSNAKAAGDFGAQQVASVYAKGFLAASEGAKQTEALLAELDAVVADVLDKLPLLDSVLASPLVRHDEKRGIIDRAFGKQLSPLALNFLKVLSAHGRLDCLRPIVRAVRTQLDHLRGRVPVQVQTATQLPEELARRIADGLRGMLGGEPLLVRETKPDLIGGMVLRIGDTVYDGSISAQLEQVRAQMINRSVHEIQSRRDSFSHPAGN